VVRGRTYPIFRRVLGSKLQVEHRLPGVLDVIELCVKELLRVPRTCQGSVELVD